MQIDLEAYSDDGIVEPVEYQLSDETAEELNPREQVVLQTHLAKAKSWMLSYGKNPENKDGLKQSTVGNYLSRIDQAFRICWSVEDQITLRLQPTHLSRIVRKLDDDEVTQNGDEPYAPSSKRKMIDALRKYAQFKEFSMGEEAWESPRSITEESHRQPDEFTLEERQQLREAALRLDSLRTYSDCSPDQRERLRIYLSQSYGIPIEDVTPAFWEEHNNSWEIPSLVTVSLDAGLRPDEVGSARVEWTRPDKRSLYIPREQSTKNREHWDVALRDDTSDILRRWLEQRTHLEKYDGSDRLWLTRESNPWSSDSLNHLLGRLCAEAEIPTDNRRIVWTSIRHSVGEHMTEKGSVSQAKEQLRHKSIESTLKYTAPSLERRRKSLDQMG